MLVDNNPKVTVLCAGPGLGFYVPGLLVQRQLKKAGIPCETEVFENFLIDEKKANVLKTKERFHKNFSFAIMGQNLAKDPSPYLNKFKTTLLLNQWKMEKRRHFIVFSGFWLTLLKQYVQEAHIRDLKIDLCHIDADYATSWKLHEINRPEFREVKFNSWIDKKVDFFMDVDNSSPVLYKDRKNNFIIHGGGWGLGHYNDKIELLNQLNFKLKVIIYNEQEREDTNSQNDYYLLNPAWNTWDTHANGEHQFPPIAHIRGGSIPDYNVLQKSDHPAVYDLIKESKAIISKPGAGTLIDSLSSATPIILLKPFGASESTSGLLWQHFGFAISFDDWVLAGYPEHILEEMHLNLLNWRSESTNYIQSYIEFYFGTIKA
jgi:hypothetical protein